MKQNSKKKLSLGKETIATLRDDEMTSVEGGNLSSIPCKLIQTLFKDPQELGASQDLDCAPMTATGVYCTDYTCVYDSTPPACYYA